MKTYHEYQSESKQAEAKLKYVQSQKPKFEKQKSKKKLKQYEKQVEKRLQKYTETKVKAFKARNEYILSIDSANACINKFCKEDVGDLVDCMDFGFHASVAKCIYMYLSGQENIKRSRQMTVDNLSRSIGDLDSNADKNNYLDYFSFVFNIQKKFQFEPHKGDEVSQVNAQSLIRYEMEKRFEQLDNRLKTLKTENDEIFKTIEATEQSLLSYFDVKNCDMSDLFRDLNLTNQNTAMNKPKRIEIEDYYVEKVKQYTTSSNLIARLEARHNMMQKALMGCVNSNNNDKLFDKFSDSVNAQQQEKKKKIGKSPIIGQPRLFGGKLIEYINATKQEIPPIITSCIKAINRLGLHNQGIFRIPGSQLEINQFKDSFEKGEDPLITVNPREMNSVAGVLKLYLRELKDPVFPREMYDTFINAMRISSNNNNGNNNSSSLSSPANQSNNEDSDSNNISLSPVENIEAMKVENIRKAMCNVPKPIYIVLRYIFAFLNHLSEFKDENMMDSYNIAICLAPTLIPVPDDKKDQVNNQTDTIELIKLIIQHNDQIFSMECEGPVYEKFDSEFENEEENIEDTDDDDEDESERQINRNISDDGKSIFL
jgi:SLIT-ROBO Rho GTPase activating protein